MENLQTAVDNPESVSLFSDTHAERAPPPGDARSPATLPHSSSTSSVPLVQPGWLLRLYGTVAGAIRQAPGFLSRSPVSTGGAGFPCSAQ